MIKTILLTLAFWSGMLMSFMKPLTITNLGVYLSGTAQNKTAATGMTVSSPSGGAAGDYVVMVVAKDNTSTTDGDNSEITGWNPGDGSTGVKLGEFTNGQGSAAAGATISIYGNFLTGSPFIPAWSFAASTTAKVTQGFRFTVTSGNLIRVAQTSTAAVDGAVPGTLSVSGLSSGSNYIIIRAIALETPAFTAVTAEAGWTSLISNGTVATSGGGGASNMNLWGEYKIVNGGITSQSSTWGGTTSADCADILIALEEYTPVSTPRRVYRIN